MFHFTLLIIFRCPFTTTIIFPLNLSSSFLFFFHHPKPSPWRATLFNSYIFLFLSFSYQCRKQRKTLFTLSPWIPPLFSYIFSDHLILFSPREGHVYFSGRRPREFIFLLATYGRKENSIYWVHLLRAIVNVFFFLSPLFTFFSPFV